MSSGCGNLANQYIYKTQTNQTKPVLFRFIVIFLSNITGDPGSDISIMIVFYFG